MKLYTKVFGSGPPVIILHGLFGMLDNWLTIARKLEDRFQCILVDLRNHGKSPQDDEMNYQVMAADILELMEEMNLEKSTLIGHSMGGKVAMQFSIDHPEKVEHLIVIDISPGEYPPHHENVIQAIQSIEPSAIENRSKAEQRFREHLGNDEATIQFLLKNISRKVGGGFEWKANMPVLILRYDDLMQAIPAGSTFEGPALFIRGELSDSVRDEDKELIRSFFPKARVLTIKGAGHWVNADTPDALAETILAFLAFKTS